MNKLNFLDINDVNIDKWAKFVEDHPRGNVFHLPGIYYAYNKTKNYKSILIYLEDNEGNTLGMLISVIKHNLFYPLNKLTERSEVYGDILVLNENPIFKSAIIRKYIDVISSKAIYSIFKNLYIQEELDKTIFLENSFIYEKHLNIRVDLRCGLNDLWKGIKRNRKDGINKGKRQGFVFEELNEPDLDQFNMLVKEVYRNIGLPFPDKTFYIALNNELKPYVKWLSLSLDRSPIIILLGLTFKGVFYAFIIGITKNPKILNLRPVDFFYWEVYKWCLANNYHTFDWMGAGKPDEEYGVRDFKIQYGGALLETGRYIKLHKPLLYKSAEFALGIWRKIKRA